MNWSQFEQTCDACIKKGGFLELPDREELTGSASPFLDGFDSSPLIEVDLRNDIEIKSINII